MSKIKERMGDISAGILLSVSLCFMLCVYAPLELFLTNQEEFWFDIKTLVFPVILFFAVATVICIVLFLVLRLINKKVYYIGLAAAMVALICSYVQGNFLVGGLPGLDGTAFDWSAASPERIKSIVLWVVAALVIGFVLFKFKEKIFKKVTLIASVCMLLLLSSTLTTLFFTTDIKTNSSRLSITNKNEFQLSTDQNVILLMIDAADSKYFDAALKRNPEAAENLKDFTDFNNTASGYPYTQLSVPLILTGEWYENKEPFNDYMSKAFKKSPFITTLEQKKYKMGLYDDGDVVLDSATHGGEYENLLCDTDTYKSLPSMIKTIVKMGGIKYAPWDLKKHCYNLVSFVDSVCTTNKATEQHFLWSNPTFWDAINDKNPITKTKDKCFRFIHIEGGHTPFQYGMGMKPITDGVYDDKCDACVSICDKYINRIKESGLYDNSAIVILADHGYDKFDKTRLNRFNPVLYIKGINEKHDKIQNNAAPISHEDLAASFAKLADGTEANNIFKYKEGDTRTRRIMYYLWKNEDHIIEYKTDGPSYDSSVMKETGKEFNNEGNGIKKGVSKLTQNKGTKEE